MFLLPAFLVGTREGPDRGLLLANLEPGRGDAALGETGRGLLLVVGLMPGPLRTVRAFKVACDSSKKRLNISSGRMTR